MQEKPSLSKRDIRKFKEQTEYRQALFDMFDGYETPGIKDAIANFRKSTQILCDMVQDTENTDDGIWVFAITNSDYGINDREIRACLEKNAENMLYTPLLGDENRIIEKAQAYLKWEEEFPTSNILEHYGKNNRVFVRSGSVRMTSKHMRFITAAGNKLVDAYQKSIN